jgi:2-iminobutanoate/2-iminopropanoate deaminase
MKERKIILTKNAPEPIGPYSQAVKVGPFLYCSGQVALDPKTGQVVGTEVEAQTRQVMTNLKGVLEAAEMDFSQVVKTTIFLKSMNDFPKVNAIYGEAFKSAPPARSTVEVSRLPKDVLVEIELIAYQN